MSKGHTIRFFQLKAPYSAQNTHNPYSKDFLLFLTFKDRAM